VSELHQGQSDGVAPRAGKPSSNPFSALVRGTRYAWSLLSPGTRRNVVNSLKYLLAFALLVYTIRSNWNPPNGKGLSYVWQRHVVRGEPLNGHYFAIAFLIFAVAMVLTLFRWYVLVRALDLPFRLREALRLGMVGFFYNTFMPGSVGGDIIKAAFLAVGQSRRTVAVATVIMDRVIALWALVWFVALSGGVFWAAGWLEGPARVTSERIILVSVAIVVASAAVWLVMGFLPDHRAERFAGRLEKLPKVGGSAAEFWRAVWMYRCRQRSVAIVFLMSWVSHLGFVIAFYCCANALWSEELGTIPSLTEHFLLVPIGMVMQALVPTPGGAGGGEWSFGALYRLFGASEANGVLGSLVQRVISWTLGLVGFVVYVRMRAAAPVPGPSAEVSAELATSAP
jgi:glycosyltransferase 2 family protein